MEQFSENYTKFFRYSFFFYKRWNFVFIDKRVLSFFGKYLRAIIHSGIVIIQFILLILYIKQAFSGVINIYDMAFVMSTDLLIFQALLKGVMVVRKKPQIEHIIKVLGTMWRDENLTDLQRSKKNKILNKVDFILKVNYWLDLIGMTQYLVLPISEVLYGVLFSSDEEPQFKFFINGVYPFDETANWIHYLLVYTSQVYAVAYIIFLYLGWKFLLMVLSGLLSVEFVLLQEDVNNLNRRYQSLDGPDEQQLNGYRSLDIKEIVENHQVLISLCSEADEIFNFAIFMDGTLATITICLFGFISKFAHSYVELARTLMTGAAVVTQIFITCYFGEMLSAASAEVGDAAYKIKWYKSNSYCHRTLCLLMQRSQRPCNLTSLGYVAITMKSFTTVLSTTWSYFSILNTMYQE